MAVPSVQVVSEANQQASLQTITLAFAADPFARWMLPSAEQFISYFPALLNIMAGSAFAHGSAISTQFCEGAALWVPPGIEPDEDVVMPLMLEMLAPEKLEIMGEVMEQMNAYHPQDDDCWYLAFIGVDPGHQNKGLGSALMKHMTAELDKRGALGYLESSNPMNVSLYERHGFEIVGEIKAADSPSLLPMIRSRKS